MNVDKRKLVRISVIALLTLSIMLAAQILYTKFSVERSLINKISEKPYVDEVELTKAAGTKVLTVRLKNVDNISETWNEINRIANQYLRGENFSLELTGNPNLDLMDLYYSEIQFPLYEALKTGNFTNMKDSFDDISDRKNITIKVFLDSSRVYLHLQKDEHYLYKILNWS